MAEEKESSQSNVEQAISNHVDLTADALSENIDNFLPGGSSDSKSDENDDKADDKDDATSA
jgi:hypothetical protein